jgi:hypothetical protein
MRSEVSTFINYLRDDGVIDDTTPLYPVKDSLNQPTKSGRGLAWNYRTGRVTLRLEPEGVEWPERATALTCNFEATVSGTVLPGSNTKVAPIDWDIQSSSLQLEFSAISKTRGGGWTQYWHFDTHRDVPDKPIPNEAHPLFHLNFGGNAMKARRTTESDCWGKCLELKAPRLVHPPMDLVLALDFILSNAAGTRWRKTYLEDKSYRMTVRNAQRRFWRPYQTSLAEFYRCGRLEQGQHPARAVVPTLRVDEL